MAAMSDRHRAIPIVALDYPDALTALDLVQQLGGRCDFYKVGSELFTAAGPEIVRELRQRDARVFLDLKLHDIPNTVAGAAAVAARMGASLLTVHASGGSRMIRAAVDAAAPRCQILAVTVLTSLAATELGEAWGRDGMTDLGAEVMRLAELARNSGARGVVCSGHEAVALHERFGDGLALLVPGLRLPGDAAGDQTRVVTPRAAAEAGGSYLVLGRAVTAARDPVMAFEEAVASLG
jgi:orotidine-5'-phosphate decarboxylase